ncbi:nucleotidyltransferase family protein [Candidatus Enterococcus mangumiae]|uniref:Nucleotidyltransferase family protein n=1 Tax=Candidatus Enterococcus mangumiae TaxID=2230878 RepID=A0ABZ2SXF8_9ENTE|nr:nucleotidyltransferase family protein [Enterococcus sp. DIV1094]MBO0490144.1 nucleotidyltransferase family protein [Enterococcus sp. DIV1094]
MTKNELLQTQKESLHEILKQDTALYQIIQMVSTMAIPELYVGAGCIVQSVWNRLYGMPIGYGISDVDIVYFDEDLSEGKELETSKKIAGEIESSNYSLDIINEARVHLWYEERFGFPIQAYGSSEEAISTWPTTATAIGVSLNENGQLQVFSPYGLDDLFEGIVRPNKKMITKEIYDQKVAKWKKKWPDLNVIPW